MKQHTGQAMKVHYSRSNEEPKLNEKKPSHIDIGNMNGIVLNTI